MKKHHCQAGFSLRSWKDRRLWSPTISSRDGGGILHTILPLRDVCAFLVKRRRTKVLHNSVPERKNYNVSGHICWKNNPSVTQMWWNTCHKSRSLVSSGNPIGFSHPFVVVCPGEFQKTTNWAKGLWLWKTLVKLVKCSPLMSSQIETFACRKMHVENSVRKTSYVYKRLCVKASPCQRTCVSMLFVCTRPVCKSFGVYVVLVKGSWEAVADIQ